MATIPTMPLKVRASQNIRSIGVDTHSTSSLFADVAVDCPWISFDATEFRNELCHDGDTPDSLEKWLSLPQGIRPTLVLDPWSGRAAYRLPLASPVCMTAKGRQGPKMLADLAGRLLASALGATFLPHRSVVKNPWGRREAVMGQLTRRGPSPVHPELYEATLAAGLCWHAIPGAGAVELKAVIAALAPHHWHEPEALKKGGPRGSRKWREANPLGRNTVLFDTVRFWTYERVEKDFSAIHDEAQRVNSAFSIPLPPAEVMATAKSIARFMAKRYRPKYGKGKEKIRGRDAVDNIGMSIPAKQSLSAKIRRAHV